MITLDRSSDLTLAAYGRVVHGGEPVALGEGGLARVEASRAAFLRHLAEGAACYGVTTGLGAFSTVDLTAEERALLPRQVLFGRAAAIGPAWPAPVARGMLLIKLAQFLGGASAVSAGLCRFMADRINDGFVPFVPSRGHGMAGEIIPLSHMAQTLIGEGRVLAADGTAIPAAEALASRGAAPFEPGPKEGISLIAGIAAAPARAFESAGRLEALLGLLDVAAAATVEGLGAATEAFDPAVATLRPDPGVADAAAAVRRLLEGSRRRRAWRQPPVSIRVVPQVHGALRHAIATLKEAIQRELTINGDNPAFLLEEGRPRLLHTGNFHPAALTAAVEAATLAASQAAILSERRLHRLLDERLSGLSPQLALRPGLDAGLVVLHKAALGLAAAIRAQAAPPSLMHGESSLGQEDAMALTHPAIDRLDALAGLGRDIAVYELYAGFVAIDLAGERPGALLDALRTLVRRTIPCYEGDRSYGPEVERLAAIAGTEEWQRIIDLYGKYKVSH